MSQPGWRPALSGQAVLAQASWVGIRVIIGYRALAQGADPVFLGVLAASFALWAWLMIKNAEYRVGILERTKHWRDEPRYPFRRRRRRAGNR